MITHQMVISVAACIKNRLTVIAAIALAALSAATALAQPSVAVDQPDYHPFSTVTDSYRFKSISAGPQAPNPAPAGSAATYLITASMDGGGKESVAFSCSGLPAGVTAAFSPVTVSASPWQSTLTLTAASSVASGTYSNITLTGTGRGDDKSVRTNTISLVVAKRAITVTAAPTRRPTMARPTPRPCRR